MVMAEWRISSDISVAWRTRVEGRGLDLVFVGPPSLEEDSPAMVCVF